MAVVRSNAMQEESLEALRYQALELVRERYEDAAQMRDANLESINQVRPPSLRYPSMDHVVYQWLAMAGAVSTFAVNVGLITSEQARQVIVDFLTAHPEMRAE
jgi:hypothetical protein